MPGAMASKQLYLRFKFNSGSLLALFAHHVVSKRCSKAASAVSTIIVGPYSRLHDRKGDAFLLSRITDWTTMTMGPPLFQWILTFALGFLAVWILLQDFSQLGFSSFSFQARRNRLLKVTTVLREFEEILMAGLVPPAERWARFGELEEPWRSLTTESLKELRDCGGALLPTLRRLRELSDAHRVDLQDARAKASQALAQAAACSMLVPLLGFSLYWIAPGIDNRVFTWLAACSIALGVAGIGAIWMIKLAENSRWGGLHSDQRSWALSAQCAGERLLALVRVGTPPDLAWVKALDLLAREAPGLAQAWGVSIWKDPCFSLTKPAERLLGEAGSAIKKAIQVSLMEGRPCSERVEATLLSLRQDMKLHVDRDLSLLPTKALKPLFICVAPALFGLLGFGLYLVAVESFGSSGGSSGVGVLGGW
jgi:hypothetical protein